MSNFEFIGKYISFLYRYHQIYLDRELKPFNISSGQFFILMPLFSKDGVNQESISYTIKMDKATITRGMQKLIDGGYVSRVRDEKDKRAYRIYLTQKGNGIKQEILEIAKRWDEILLANLNPEQLEDVKSEFNTMFDNVSEYFKR